MKYLHQIPHIRAGLDHFLSRDPVFVKLTVAPEDLKWSYTKPGFDSLVRIVIGQQVSTAAARTVWGRFKDKLGKVDAAGILAMKDRDMQSLGLSKQKTKYIRGLAEAVQSKTFNPKQLDKLSDAQVHEEITALKGFGPWSAQMYLMFSLARPNVWPAGDLGIQDGLRIYLNKKARPTAEQTLKEQKRFAPHCTAAAILLWHLKSVS